MSEYSINIKDMPENMRPREKLMENGEASLSDAELLAIVLGSGSRELNALDLAMHLLSKHDGNLRYLREASLEELITERGIGPAKAVAIKAAIEMGKRIAGNIKIRRAIKSPEDVRDTVKELLMEDMRNYDREHFRVLYLDRKGGLLVIEDVSIGGLHSSIVHPREVFKTAVKKSAASVILVHNHPSGDPAPSAEDIEVTRRLFEAGKIMGIEVLDHVIIGESAYCSLKERGLI
ncbi:MAG: DNA repair protein RadC [Syntrophomonadaceae bacterium]|nr:DNA repair protein RadC [Syntrophomonadaceae bacterium]MDD3022962.1 DNA repair protein RadC [Syntrophomonadaceae bacterium]